MYYYYILVDGKYQLFISKNQDNILGGFVERLSELLTIANIKPTQLAKNLGVKSATITRYLSGIRKPRLEMLFKIADYFHCSIDFLLGRSDTGEHFDPLPLPDFKERFSFLLDFYKKSRYRLVKDTHIDESIIYDWQNGKFSPGIESLIVMADYFECSIEFILGREN